LDAGLKHGDYCTVAAIIQAQVDFAKPTPAGTEWTDEMVNTADSTATKQGAPGRATGGILSGTRAMDLKEAFIQIN